MSCVTITLASPISIMPSRSEQVFETKDSFTRFTRHKFELQRIKRCFSKVMSHSDTKAVSCLKAVQFNVELPLIRSVRHNTCNSTHLKSLTFFL